MLVFGVKAVDVVDYSWIRDLGTKVGLSPDQGPRQGCPQIRE